MSRVAPSGHGPDLARCNPGPIVDYLTREVSEEELRTLFGQDQLAKDLLKAHGPWKQFVRRGGTLDCWHDFPPSPYSAQRTGFMVMVKVPNSNTYDFITMRARGDVRVTTRRLAYSTPALNVFGDRMVDEYGEITDEERWEREVTYNTYTYFGKCALWCTAWSFLAAIWLLIGVLCCVPFTADVPDGSAAPVSIVAGEHNATENARLYAIVGTAALEETWQAMGGAPLSQNATASLFAALEAREALGEGETDFGPLFVPRDALRKRAPDCDVPDSGPPEPGSVVCTGCVLEDKPTTVQGECPTVEVSAEPFKSNVAFAMFFFIALGALMFIPGISLILARPWYRIYPHNVHKAERNSPYFDSREWTMRQLW